MKLQRKQPAQSTTELSFLWSTPHSPLVQAKIAFLAMCDDANSHWSYKTPKLQNIQYLILITINFPVKNILCQSLLILSLQLTQI